MEQRETLTLQQLQQRINRLITCDATRDVWVTAELSDVAVRGGHCYMELLQKDQDGAVTLAKARGIIWSSALKGISAKFHAVTGRPLATGNTLLSLSYQSTLCRQVSRVLEFSSASWLKMKT